MSPSSLLVSGLAEEEPHFWTFRAHRLLFTLRAALARQSPRGREGRIFSSSPHLRKDKTLAAAAFLRGARRVNTCHTMYANCV